jgi:type IV secretion system protein VirB11
MGREEDDLEYQNRLTENLLRDLGPLIPYFNSSSVTNVFVYGSGEVEIEEFGRGTYYTDFSLSVDDRMRIINSLASVVDIAIDLWDKPTLEAIIPDYKIRTTAILTPWVQYPEITFRRPALKVYTLDEYVSSGRLSKELYEKICLHLEKRSNIVVSGSTGSGKTTFTNALLHRMNELTPDERFYIIEDVPELQCSAKRTTQLYIRKEQAILAIQTALRWTPKRIIFGEIRSGDIAVELLEAWNTGHPGNVTTIHADNALSTVFRIEGLLRQRIQGKLPDLRWSIGLIVHLGSIPGFGPVIDEVLTMQEIDEMRRREGME